MEEFFPDYLKRNIRTIKLAEDKSKGQVVCSCGCEEFDYNYLFFKYTPTEEDKKMAELQNLSREMREKHIGPFKFLQQKCFIALVWERCNGKQYTVMYAEDMYAPPARTHSTIEEIINDPYYIGHFEPEPFDPTKPCEYQHIYAKCKHCGKEILLFDERYYGYDGIITQFEQPNKPYLSSGKFKIKRPHCESTGYHIYVTIWSTGKEELFEDADNVITDENWKDAFDWIKIDIECAKCGKKKNVLNLETM